MAAIAAVFSLVPVGGRVVMPEHAYKTGVELARTLAATGAIQLTLVPIADTDAVIRELDRGDVALLYIETPTNPMLEVADAPTLVDVAHRAGALVAFDNTFATPIGQRPFEWGADVVLHSVTKFISGHADVVLGAALARSEDSYGALRRHRALAGAIPGPFETFLALRGLRTLPLRFERASANAAVLAERLAAHPAVHEVRYPGLVTDPGHERAKAQMDLFGAIIGFRVAAGPNAADDVSRTARLWLPATSLGGVESLLERRRRWAGEPESVPQDFIRLAVGIENVDDLWRDLSAALDTTL
jgi:cystathionine gamma-synthase